jgi:ferredoxin-NADP reductase
VDFSFTPGQFISVIDRVGSKEIRRPYSIASPRAGNRFALCLNRVHGGITSPHLFRLQPGENIEIGKPVGNFTLRHPGRNVVFIATGTGIAPFRSMLLDHLPRSKPQITLLYGARYEEGLLYREEFEQLACIYPSFKFMPTVTRPSLLWRGRRGRVQEHLDEALGTQKGRTLASVDVYVCGLREMVDDIRRELEERGLERGQIFYERYDVGSNPQSSPSYSAKE